MEKLQAAIEKARSQRDVDGDAPKGRSVPEPPASVLETWKALKPIDLQRSVASRNRVVSFIGGSEAAPYDLLRTKILNQIQSQGWKRIAIVSPHSMCGKTTTAANLAFSFGRQSDLRTLVFDFDLRRGGLAKILGERVGLGMEDVLRRQASFAEVGLRYGDNVAFGLNGGPVRNSAELLQSYQTQEVLDEIEKSLEPDIVIFDMPPLMASDDSLGFLKYVDCALMLAAADKTNIDHIDVSERQLAELTNVLGIVLNKCRYNDGAYGYEYGYGYDTKSRA